jgi:hypothetical protein
VALPFIIKYKLKMLKLKTSTCVTEGCTLMTISDVTGIYDSINNTTGWGTPNPAKSSITSATIEITAPGPGQITSTGFDVTSVVVASSSSIQEFALYSLSPSDIGLSSVFSSGIYEIKYTVVAGEDTYVGYSKIIVTCQEKCCIDKMWAAMATKAICCDCDEFQQFKKVLLASDLLQLLDQAGSCMNISVVNSTINRIQRICLFNDCGC